MRVFITGASGFVGSHVTRQALAAGWEVSVLVRPGADLRQLGDPRGGVQCWEGDLADLAPLRPRLQAWRPQVCIHCAWYAKPGKYLDAAENIQYVFQSLMLLEELIAAGCEMTVMVGTCAEYDPRTNILSEEGPTLPRSLYGAAKLALGLLGSQVAARAGRGFAWARLFHMYGPYEDEGRVVPALIRSLMAGRRFLATAGEQIRDYLHVGDVASGLLTIAARRVAGTFNIASGIPITIRHLMETIGTLMGRPELIEFGGVPYRDGEPPILVGDSRRLRDLGWEPRFDLQKGLRQTIDWWELSAGSRE